MECIANITAANGWMLAALGIMSVFFALTLLLVLIVVLMKYSADRKEGATTVATIPIPKGMKALSNASLHNEDADEALSKDYRDFLASLRANK